MRDLPTEQLEEWKRQGFNPENCPVRLILAHIASKWTSLIILELASAPRRFNELGRILPDISKRMLTQSLRTLERDGLVTRTVFDTNPPSVEYKLTALGQSFIHPFSQLINWAEDSHQGILKARETYDGKGA